MKCHYEVLDIGRDADDSQIKSAYRKLALKWHPDKNLENEEFAKEQFQLVQQAYEILIDKQERAWYDNHREQILRGSDSEFQDNSLNVFQYFTTTCFKGYSDGENGFYAVYRKVFEEITKEDMEFMDGKEEFCEIPAFGTAMSDYDEIVGPFYAYWTSYSTKKSYVWLDPYGIKETRERRVLKLIEKENKKVRLKAKKERNDEVRSLVAFVKKRDKRVQENAKRVEAKIQENRQKQEQLSQLKRLERYKQLNENNSQAEWSKFDNVQSELEEVEKRLAQQFGEQLSDDCGDSDCEEELSNLYCVACNKIFKTPKAFQNHESSKKHKDNIEKLKISLFDEEEELSAMDSLDLEDCEDDDDMEAIVSDTESDISETLEAKSKKKSRKSKNVIKLQDTEQDFTETTEIKNENEKLQATDKDVDCDNSKKHKKRKNKKNSPKTNYSAVNPDIFETSTSKDVKESLTEKPRKVKKSKNKQKKKDEDIQETQLDTSHCCVTCKSDFSSKNKLFDHLKKTGHSVYLPQESDKITKARKRTVRGM